MEHSSTNGADTHLDAIEARKAELLGEPLLQALDQLGLVLGPAAADALSRYSHALITRVIQAQTADMIGVYAEIDTLRQARG